MYVVLVKSAYYFRILVICKTTTEIKLANGKSLLAFQYHPVREVAALWQYS